MNQFLILSGIHSLLHLNIRDKYMSSDNKINVFFNEYNLLVGSGGVMYLPFMIVMKQKEDKIPTFSTNGII